MPRTPPEAAPIENGDISSAASPEAVTTTRSKASRSSGTCRRWRDLREPRPIPLDRPSPGDDQRCQGRPLKPRPSMPRTPPEAAPIENRLGGVRHRVDEALRLVVCGRARPFFRLTEIQHAVVALVLARARPSGRLHVHPVEGGVARLLALALSVVFLVALVFLDHRRDHFVEHGSSR